MLLIDLFEVLGGGVKVSVHRYGYEICNGYPDDLILPPEILNENIVMLSPKSNNELFVYID